MPFVSKRIPIENKVANFLKMHTTPASFDPSTRRPRDSYVEDFLRFGSDQSTLEDYKNMTGTGIRMGKILEDMDVLAAIVAFAHSTTEENKHILQVVTATLDRIDLIQPLPVDRDIKLSGFTTYVGTSSMEVTLTMECLTEPAPKPGQESFGYDASLKKTDGEVAIDKTTVTPMKIAPLRLETEEDYSLYDKGAGK
ncbi:hypothetical protein HDV02_004358 [Globomyces sp. JEL0801]|nr:hypothetical protein HDV02_004358 [Globomyces sp. JEL0801]